MNRLLRLNCITSNVLTQYLFPRIDRHIPIGLTVFSTDAFVEQRWHLYNNEARSSQVRFFPAGSFGWVLYLLQISRYWIQFLSEIAQRNSLVNIFTPTMTWHWNMWIVMSTQSITMLMKFEWHHHQIFKLVCVSISICINWFLDFLDQYPKLFSACTL